MSIENFIWDKQNESVSWSYNGKIIMKRYENMHFAYLDLKENYILVKTGKNYNIEQFYHISFEGKHIFSVDMISGKVGWQLQDRQIEVHCKNIVSAELYIKHGIIMIISAENQMEKMLKGFALDGTLLFEKKPPKGYTFHYLSASNNLPTVVCSGGKENADAYGRNLWHFSINPQTGEMLKISLAY